jgi:hypothetical protein
MATTIRGNDNFDTASPIPAGNFTAKAWMNMNASSNSIRDDGGFSSFTDSSEGYKSFALSNATPSSTPSVVASRVHNSSVTNSNEGGDLGCYSITSTTFTSKSHNSGATVRDGTVHCYLVTG